jgi:hypothetical protein
VTRDGPHHGVSDTGSSLFGDRSQMSAARANPAATLVAQANAATMQVQRSSSAIENRFVIPTLPAKTATSLVIKGAPTKRTKAASDYEATPKYPRERTRHSDFGYTRLIFVGVSRSCHSATYCREERAIYRDAKLACLKSRRQESEQARAFG